MRYFVKFALPDGDELFGVSQDREKPQQVIDELSKQGLAVLWLMPAPPKPKETPFAYAAH